MPRKKADYQNEIAEYLKDYRGGTGFLMELIATDCKAWTNILILICKNTITLKFKFYKTMLIITGTRIVENNTTRTRTKFHIEETIDANTLQYYKLSSIPEHIVTTPDEFELDVRSATLESVIRQLAKAHIFHMHIECRTPTILRFNAINLTTNSSSVSEVKAMERDTTESPDEDLNDLLTNSKGRLISAVPMQYIIDMDSGCFKEQMSKLSKATHSSFTVDSKKMLIRGATLNMDDKIMFDKISQRGLREINVLDNNVGTITVQFDPCSIKKFLTGLRNIPAETSILLKFGSNDLFILCYNISTVAQVNVLVIRTIIDKCK